MTTLIRDYDIEQVDVRKVWVLKASLQLFRLNGHARFKDARTIDREKKKRKKERERKGDH